MSKPGNSMEEAEQLMEEMTTVHKLTPVAIDRAIQLYQGISTILTKYHDKLHDNEQVFLMEKEMIIALGKEIDRNFFEGMLDAAMKTMLNVTKIPQVKDIQKNMAADVAKKFANSDKPEAGQIKDLLNKLGVNLDNFSNTASQENEFATAEAFPSRLKKGDLN